jgi:3-oxoacyl-[acyl-carrier protein] reductase
MGMPGYGLYCATKAAIVNLTKALAIELAPQNINVNAIAPGNTSTPMNEDIRTDPEMKPVYEFMESRTPSNRVYSTAEEMAGVALLLASEDGRAMHGSTVVIDEGVSAGMI